MTQSPTDDRLVLTQGHLTPVAADAIVNLFSPEELEAYRQALAAGSSAPWVRWGSGSQETAEVESRLLSFSSIGAAACPSRSRV